MTQRLRPLLLTLLAVAAAASLRAPAIHAQTRPMRVAAMSADDIRAWDTAIDRMQQTGELRSGALNEAFSDMMGTAVEIFYQPAGSGPLKADYLMAEDVVTPGGIRSLSDPGSFGDPDHYSHRYLGTGDNGGVHTNANIATHAYYLAIEGGTDRTSGLSVSGVGAANRDQIEKVFYRAFTQLMPADATFAVARAASVQSARDLYGTGSAAERAVAQAWTAVGVN